jgi:hypothetical protein
MAILPGAVEHGEDEHEFFRFTDFVNDTIGKPSGKPPAHLSAAAATGVQIRTFCQAIKDLKHCGYELAAQLRALPLIPRARLRQVAPDFWP